MNMAPLLLLVVAFSAWADDAQLMEWFVTDNTVPAQPVARLQVTTYNATRSRQFAWPIYSLLYQDSDQEKDDKGPASESVALYGKMVKGGKAPGWALVGEARCMNTGGCYAAEFDLVNETDEAPGDHRTAVFVPAWGKRGGVGLEIFGPFRTGIQMSAGLPVNLDGGNGDAEVKFDPATGYVGFWNARRGRWIAAWNADTNQAVVGKNPE